MAGVVANLCLDSLPSETKNHELQFIPAEIRHNGPAEIKTYFGNFIVAKREDSSPEGLEGDKSTKLEATLRGRPLDGEIIKMPEGFKAVVFQAGGETALGGDSAEKTETMRAIKKLDRFTYWNYDKRPSKEDKFRQALQFVDLAKVMHEESDEESD